MSHLQTMVQSWPTQVPRVMSPSFTLHCLTLTSNTTVIHSNLRFNVIEALYNIFIMVRKCYNRPYWVGRELWSLLTKGIQCSKFLNVESSSEFEKISLFDKLGDFLQQRFGDENIWANRDQRDHGKGSYFLEEV